MPPRFAKCGFFGLLAGGLLCIAEIVRAETPAPDPTGATHWAFQPVKRPAIPQTRASSWIATPIDAFVLARLEKDGLQPAAPADRRTLLRRVYLDLIGLPPTPEEQRAFLEDASPDAYARVVDDLLSRPQYGERWGRHWLDVVRFAETNGYERDGAKPQAWRYRDYVIDAFNKDKPFDCFLTEQLAGDELSDTSAEAQIATTFLRLGTWDDEPAEPMVDRYDQLDDVLGTTAAAFLGVTLRCARCHDHKFEPFSQAEYYQVLSVFEPLKRPQIGRKELERPVGSRLEVEAYLSAVARIDEQVGVLTKKTEELNRAILERAAVELRDAKGSAAAKKYDLPQEAIEAFRVPLNEQTTDQKSLVVKYTTRLHKDAATPMEKDHRQKMEQEIANLEASRPRPLPSAYVWFEDSAKAPVTRILKRGDPAKPGKEVSPALPAVLAKQQPAPPQALAKSTGRRLWLARWMTSPDNPLVARVMVNRIWQHHFGKGIVATPNDFGVVGEPPTYPELLDWLASEFRANGWKQKPLHRLIVLSNAYRMSTAPASTRAAFLSHWPQRRLEAEAVRDSILAVSGRLNPQQGGPSVYPTLPRAVLEGQSRPGEGWGKSDEFQASRRSIYIYVKRVLRVPELDLLDAPNTAESCEQRPVSTTGPQALTFLNGDFANQQAHHFAERLRREVGDVARAQIERAFVLALCRPPRPEEMQAALEFLAKQQRQIEMDASKNKKPEIGAAQEALAAFCLVLLNTNEFVYLQ
jgi:hypothetical protein